MCFRRNKHLLPHEVNGCSHNWIHNAGKQCKLDKQSSFLHKKRADSRNIAYMYICTMCGEELWSSDKMFNIPHYRVKEVERCQRRKKKR